jgi:hypothetical protein
MLPPNARQSNVHTQPEISYYHDFENSNVFGLRNNFVEYRDKAL